MKKQLLEDMNLEPKVAPKFEVKYFNYATDKYEWGEVFVDKDFTYYKTTHGACLLEDGGAIDIRIAK